MNDEDEVPSLKKVRKATAKSIATIGNKDHRLIENHSPEKEGRD